MRVVSYTPNLTGYILREHLLTITRRVALKPPYSVLVDTNFLSHTVRAKLELQESLMNLLLAKCQPIITSCVMAELEKLGPKYRIALRIARDERWDRLQCDHKGTYGELSASVVYYVELC